MDYDGGRRGGRGGMERSYGSRGGEESYRYNRRREEDVEVDAQKDRKLRRKADKQAKKRARIETHEQWTQQRRRARMEAEQRRSTRQEASQRRPVAAIATRGADRAESGQKKERKGKENRKGGTIKAGRPQTSPTTVAEPQAADDDEDLSFYDEEKIPSAPPARPSLPPAKGINGTIPAAIHESTRRCLNKLSITNVVALTRDVSNMFSGGGAGTSRAAVMESLMIQIDRQCAADAGELTQTSTLPVAGLLRGLQILHGSQVGAELVERLCHFFSQHLLAAEEHAAGNTAMVLAQLYLLYGVDAVLIVSLLRSLMQRGSAGPVRGVGRLEETVLCAASCALTLLRACGAKLLKEAPAEMDSVLTAAKAAANDMSGSNTIGRVRFQALVSVMSDIASGHTRKGRRTVTESDAPVEAMLKELCTILPGGDRPGVNMRTLVRVVHTVSTLSGLSWAQVTAEDKPPRWYVPGVMAEAGEAGHTSLKEDAGAMQDSGDVLSESGSSGADSEPDDYALRMERIRVLRQEERAISGQRFNTEHRKEVFRCVATAADDLECFNMLMHRDPTYSRFHDVCAVLLQCCVQEKMFNPYYAQVLERFCSSKNACKKTLQFAIWDRFKSIRIDSVDIAGYLNLSCAIAMFIESGVFTLSLLRGLDLETTNKTTGLFTRILVLRLIVQLPAVRLTEVFFGGDGFNAHDVEMETAAFRNCLKKFMEQYFMDEGMSQRWLPMFYDVCVTRTVFDANHRAVEGETIEARLQSNGLRTTASLSTAAASSSSVLRMRTGENGGTITEEEKLQAFMKRVRVAFKALKQGIS